MSKKLYPFWPYASQNIICKWWQMIIPKMFGKKYRQLDGRYEVISYYYKGKIYITKFGHK